MVTAVLDVFVTLAENCCVRPVVTVAVFGLTVTTTAGAVKVTTAIPDFVESACEGGYNCHRPTVGTFAGAVYKPDELIVPMLAALADVLLTCQVTAVFVVPETVAVNCCVWPVRTLAVAGCDLDGDWRHDATCWPAHAASAAATAMQRNCRIAREKVNRQLVYFHRG